MTQPLRVVDPDRLRTTDMARKAVRRWRSDADRMKLGISNQDHSGATHLAVDEVLKRTEREMPKQIIKRKPFWVIQFGYALMVLFLLIVTGAAVFIIAEALK